MEELAKIFRHFFGRDLIFMFAGAVPLLTIAHVLHPDAGLAELRLEDVSWIWFPLGAGAAFTIAYVAQEVFCLIGLTSTAYAPEPSTVTRWLVERYEGEPYRPIGGDFDWFAAERRMDDSPQNERVVANFERIVSLMQLGTTLGPCSILSGLLLCGAWWLRSPRPLCADSEGMAVIIAIVVGLLFLALGSIKRAQLRSYVHRAFPAATAAAIEPG